MVSVAQAPAPAIAHEAAPAAAPAIEAPAAAPAAPAQHAAAPAANQGESKSKAAQDAHLAHVAHAYAMYSSVAIGGLGILLAFGVYMMGWVNPDAMAERFKPLYDFLYNKWYFDELYEATLINGSKAISRGCAWFDNNVVDGLVNLSAQIGVFIAFLVGKFDNAVIDGAVNGMADLTIGSGSILRRVQTGKLYHYVFILAGGALVIFLIKFL
jgi:NADH-quinone oxidoreductase subunit L